MSQPPPYTLTDKKPPDRRRHSYYPTTDQSQQQGMSYNRNSFHQPNNNQSPLGRTSQSLSYHPDRSNSQKSSKRGLGGLIAGLGVASMLNSAMNQQRPSTSSYQPASPHHQPSTHQQPSPHHRQPVEDPLAILARYDTILLIDDSGSMSFQNRWREAGTAVAGLADALVRYDSDGIDVYFLNSIEYLRNVVSATQVNRLFERVAPIGPCTPTDVRVEQLLNIYLDRLEHGKANNLPPVKPLNLIIITDGQADDPDALAYVLSGITERLDRGRFPLNQLGVQFIQIGNDRNAAKFLQSLDDDLRSTANTRRDIVDTTPYQGRVTTDFIIKSLLGGINKRIDHQTLC